MWVHTPDRYFWWVTWPDDDNIEFWSKQFNELVFRFKIEWLIPRDYAEKFLQAEKWYSFEVLSSINDFHRNSTVQYLIH